MAKTETDADSILAAIQKIDEDAEKLREKQIDKLREAKKGIQDRMREFQTQLTAIDRTIGRITGKAVIASGAAGGKATKAEMTERRAAILKIITDAKEIAMADIIAKMPNLQPIQVRQMVDKLKKDKEVKKTGTIHDAMYHPA